MRWFVLICVCLTFAGCGLDETTHRSDKPLSLEEVNKDGAWISSLPFPTSTTNVYYFFHAGGLQEYEFVVRFTVDPKDLNGAVSNLCAYNDKTAKEGHSFTPSYISTSISNAHRQPFDLSEIGLKSTPWWNPDSITNGYYCGNTNDLSFDIWADIPNHTIYLSEID